MGVTVREILVKIGVVGAEQLNTLDTVDKKIAQVGQTGKISLGSNLKQGASEANSALEMLGGKTLDLDKAISTVSPTIGNMVNSLAQIGSGVGIAASIALISKEIWNLGVAGAKLEDVEWGFNALATEVGQSSKTVIAAMRMASKETVDDTDMMTLASQTWMQGLNLSADQLGQLMEVARVRSRTMGVDVATAFNQATTAIVSGMPRALKQFGVRDLDISMEFYARTLGKAASDLTDNERSIVAFNEVVKASKGLINAQGDAFISNSEKIAQMNIKLNDAKEKVELFIAPFVGGMADFVTKGIEGWVEASDKVAVMKLPEFKGLTAQQDNIEVYQSEVNRLTGAIQNYQNIEASGRNLSSEEASDLAILRNQLEQVRAKLDAATGAFSAFNEQLVISKNMMGGKAWLPSVVSGIMPPEPFMPAIPNWKYGPSFESPGAIDYAARGLAQQHLEEAEANRKIAEQAANDWKSAMERAADNLQSKISTLFSSAIENAKRLLPDLLPGGGDITKPGANGPFENLYRALAVAQDGNNEWAKTLGINQEQAKKVSTDFQAGLMTPEVMKLIDVDALVAKVQQDQAAEQSQMAFAKTIAMKANVPISTAMQSMGVAPLLSSGAQAGDQFQSGLSESFKGADLIAPMITNLTVAIENSEKQLCAAGETLANFVVTGAKRGFSNMIDVLLQLLLPGIMAAFDWEHYKNGKPAGVMP